MPFESYEPQEDYIPHFCTHREHNPPGMIVLRPGKHVYVCPGCGQRTTISVPITTC